MISKSSNAQVKPWQFDVNKPWFKATPPPRSSVSMWGLTRLVEYLILSVSFTCCIFAKSASFSPFLLRSRIDQDVKIEFWEVLLLMLTEYTAVDQNSSVTQVSSLTLRNGG